MNEMSAKAAKNFVANLDYLFTSMVGIKALRYKLFWLRLNKTIITIIFTIKISKNNCN